MTTAAPMPVVGDLLKTNTHLVLLCCRPGCPRPERRLSAIEAVELLGLERPMEGLARRLRCSSCGARGRDGFITARPCTLDWAAWAARDKHRRAVAAGAPPAWSLEDELATLRRLVGGGELGGDGPVQWPAERPSGGV